ncbi:MAG: collagenase [Bacteroidetes bacterium GWE2_29_8]|nr:MAG: collagenase [Bacteroidetes bacterium GWE2_29_8]OFY19361.1 MAG: collagenase [Bacteroidetes bacterium GWF2_29_10]
MSPVGSFESLMAAIQGGADSVYFGIGRLNMRSRSSVNFSIEDLENIVNICKQNNINSYLTLNTVMFDEELNEVETIISKAKSVGVNAIIASDMSVFNIAQKHHIQIHASTQTNITNIEALKFYSKYSDVVVLAREVNLKQIKKIAKQIEEQNITGPSGNLVRLEIFIHGALCMSVSGKCYLSLDTQNYSANRGACLQPCRRGYIVKDKEEENIEMAIENEYIMSPQDLCTIGFLDKIVEAGISIFKIEGRGRSPEYVKKVTQCYKHALNSIEEGTYTEEKIEKWTEELKSVYNRGFWNGYYLGQRLGEWTKRYGSQATKTKIYIGKITNFFSNINVAEIKIETGELSLNDEIVIIGPSTGVIETNVSEIRVELKKVNNTIKGETCSIPIGTTVRRSDKLYKLVLNNE